MGFRGHRTCSASLRDVEGPPGPPDRPPGPPERRGPVPSARRQSLEEAAIPRRLKTCREEPALRGLRSATTTLSSHACGRSRSMEVTAQTSAQTPTLPNRKRKARGRPDAPRSLCARHRHSLPGEAGAAGRDQTPPTAPGLCRLPPARPPYAARAPAISRFSGSVLPPRG